MSGKLSCRDVSRLVSESMDHRLPISQTVEMKMHLFMCKFCSRFKKQVHSIQQVIRDNPNLIDEMDHGGLSQAAKDRINRLMQSNACD
jgi:hypothetical protein